MKMRHKQQKDENFPVANLMIKKSLRPIVNAYYQAARFCDDIADDPKLNPSEKLAKLNQIEKIFLGYETDIPKQLSCISQLRKVFIEEQLDTSLFTDLLIAFRRDSEGYFYQTWTQLLDYCRYSAAPAGRFMLAIHDENVSTYLPSGILCAVLQIVNHIQDVKYDCDVQKRVYLPQEKLEAFGLAPDDLCKPQSSPQLAALITEISGNLQAMLEDVKPLPAIIKSLRLRIQVCIILSLTNIMLKKFSKSDILQKNIKLSKIDWIRAIIAGIFKGLFTRAKVTGTII